MRTSYVNEASPVNGDSPGLSEHALYVPFFPKGAHKLQQRAAAQVAPRAQALPARLAACLAGWWQGGRAPHADRQGKVYGQGEKGVH